MANQPLIDAGAEPDRDRIRALIEDEFGGHVVLRTGGGAKQVLHAPCDHETEAEEPLCGSLTIDGDWIGKSLLVYPPGHRDWCRRCLIRMFPDVSNVQPRVTR